ncbi:hypothetical protein [Streptomyces sp. NBC_00310]|uniref:hypothetical protein n=1 Tax=Streptomyces sp. NBC_00310 TaxID=2903645 RepID=UPI002E1A8958
MMTGLRLLPWTTPDGKPCYLDQDTAHPGVLSLLADSVEASQLGSAEQVLAGSRAVLQDPAAGERAVRFALTRAAESLEDVLRIAVSRGQRIGEGDPDTGADTDTDTDAGAGAEVRYGLP